MTQSIIQLTFHKKHYPEMVDIANRLAKLERRKAHDAIRLLILESGEARLNFPEEYKDFIRHIENLKKEKSTIQSASLAG